MHHRRWAFCKNISCHSGVCGRRRSQSTSPPPSYPFFRHSEFFFSFWPFSPSLLHIIDHAEQIVRNSCGHDPAQQELVELTLLKGKSLPRNECKRWLAMSVVEDRSVNLKYHWWCPSSPASVSSCSSTSSLVRGSLSYSQNQSSSVTLLSRSIHWKHKKVASSVRVSSRCHLAEEQAAFECHHLESGNHTATCLLSSLCLNRHPFKTLPRTPGCVWRRKSSTYTAIFICYFKADARWARFTCGFVGSLFS